MNNDKEEFNTSQSTEFGWSLIEGTEIYLFRVYDFSQLILVGALLSFFPSF